MVKVRLDKRSTGISVLVALGVRRDGQKVLLGLRNMGGESEAAWRAFLDDLVARKLATPDLLIIDGAPGLEAALAALWPTVPVQRCINIATSLPMRPRSCTTRSAPTTPT